MNRILFKDTIKKYIKCRLFFYRIIYWIQYAYYMMTKQPYFGPILNATQCWPERYPIMHNLIRKELEKAKASYRILEIGTWAGHSATLWASACKEKGKGRVFCIDTWGGSGNTPQLRNKTKRILNLFYHNIRVSGLENYIISIKGSSDLVAEILQPNTFDLVFIDGDHAYVQFKMDLSNYMKVVKTGGIICGDDLELYPNEIDTSEAKKHCEEDFIFDTKSKKYFHPGVVLGISEIFGNNVSMKNGFWAMRRVKDGWESIIL